LIVAYGGAAVFVAPSAHGLLVTSPRLLRHYLSGLSGLRGLSADYPEFVATAAGAASRSGAPVLADAHTAEVVALAALALPLSCMAVAAWLLRWLRRPRSAFPLAWFTVVCASIVLIGGFQEPGADRHAYPLLAPGALLLALAASALIGRGDLSLEGRRFESEARRRGRIGRRVGFRARRPTGNANSQGPPARATAAQVCAAVLGVALISVCARASYVRSAVWKDEASLWRATLEARPRSLRAHINLAAVYAEHGHRGRARHYLEGAVKLRRDYGPAYLGLAYLSCLRGRRQAAGAHLQRAAACGETRERIDEIRRVCGQAGGGASRAAQVSGLRSALGGD